LDVIAGPTGGYLLGMPVAALVLGTVASETPEDTSDRNRYVRIAIGMVLGHVIILAMGIPWQQKVQLDLDVMALAERLYRPVLLKSALGLLLSVVAMRSAAPRA
jgi:biotin transporter BioY